MWTYASYVLNRLYEKRPELEKGLDGRELSRFVFETCGRMFGVIIAGDDRDLRLDLEYMSSRGAIELQPLEYRDKNFVPRESVKIFLKDIKELKEMARVFPDMGNHAPEVQDLVKNDIEKMDSAVDYWSEKTETKFFTMNFL